MRIPRATINNQLTPFVFIVLLLAICFAWLTTPCNASTESSEDNTALALTPWPKWWRIPIPPEKLKEDQAGVRFEAFKGTGEQVAVLRGCPSAPAVLESIELDGLSPGRYRLSFELLKAKDAEANYVTVDFFGKTVWLDNHCVIGGWQPFSIDAELREGQKAKIVLFTDRVAPFLMRAPVIRIIQEPTPLPPAQSAQSRYGFPIGVYGASLESFSELKACGFNTAYAGFSLEKLREGLTDATKAGIQVILPISSDPVRAEQTATALEDLPPTERPLYFYLVDEPEIRSFSTEKLLRARQVILAHLPWARFATAMVRPQMISQYTAVYDALFMDQYPVTSQPMNWLVDSIVQAKSLARPDTSIWAVVQAFGDGRYTKMGWPRKPTEAEMQALAFSALTEGVQGILFFTWSDHADDEAFRKEMCSVTGRIKQFDPYLPLNPGLPDGYDAKPMWRVKNDPGGNPAIRFGWRRVEDKCLIVAVNLTRYKTRWMLHLPGRETGLIADLWDKMDRWIYRGTIDEMFEPLGVRAWLIPAQMNSAN